MRICAHLLREVLPPVEGAHKAPSTLFTSPALPHVAGQDKGGKLPPKESLIKHRRCVVEALAIVAGILLIGAFLWTGRVLWYALSGEYEIDQRLNSIGK